MDLTRRDTLRMVCAAPLMGWLGREAFAQLPQGGPEENVSGKPYWRIFEPPFLSEIAFPLGGIGTGTIALGGRGQLRDWEICNHPHKGHTPHNTFFAVWFRQGQSAPRGLVLESRLEPPYRGARGLLGIDGMPGLPRFERGRFYGAYPFARVELEDSNVPLRASLDAYNPLIPGNVKDSALPVAFFHWHIENTSEEELSISVQLSLSNICGDDLLGQNTNGFMDKDGLRGLWMNTLRLPQNHPKYGTMALITDWEDVSYLTRWGRQKWFDDLWDFWQDFMEDGRLTETVPSSPTPLWKTDTCSLCLSGTIPPRETKTFPFILAWHFPNIVNYWNSEEEVRGIVMKNYYTGHFVDAWAAAVYTYTNRERLETETKQFHETLFRSTFPPEVVDAVSSQISVLRSTTCFLTDDERFWGFEGSDDFQGCCPLNCTHVWNYEQTLAYLFPSLERSMRVTDFLDNTDDTGDMVFRTIVPVGRARWKHPPAADGQMGTIVRLYREWQLSGDRVFLERLWPKAKLALEYAWKGWDGDRDGVMEGEQHNTYDIEFWGPNPLTGCLYLAALEAGARMAEELNDNRAAIRYRELAAAGQKKLDEQCWNGEYYKQATTEGRDVKYQFADGCLSDQLLGQWMARQLGLGYLLPPDRVKQTLESIYQYNFKTVLAQYENTARVFALSDEGGLVLCTWPKGNRPKIPFLYAGEVWTGSEYQLAAHLIYEGAIEKALEIVRTVRSRYDGERRNPWNEVECGNHYVRAMAGWSLLLALSGFHYSGPEQSIKFAPPRNENKFHCFWSCGPGWGNYRQVQGPDGIEVNLDVMYGRLELKSFEIPAPELAVTDQTLQPQVKLEEQLVKAKAERQDDGVRVTFGTILPLERGVTLTMVCR